MLKNIEISDSKITVKYGQFIRGLSIFILTV